MISNRGLAGAVNWIVRKLGEEIPFELIPHAALKERSRKVKGIIRTGGCTANSNVLLVSGDSGKFHRECHGGEDSRR